MDEIQTFLKESNLIEEEPSKLAQEHAEKAWSYISGKKKLTTHNIRHCHKILMKTRSIADKDRGNWRKCRIFVGGREGKPWFELDDLMHSWVDAVNNSLKSNYVEKGEKAKGAVIAMHIDFEYIHPFVDGNGRLGRILMNWHALKLGLPIMIIRNHAKQQYYGWFK